MEGLFDSYSSADLEFYFSSKVRFALYLLTPIYIGISFLEGLFLTSINKKAYDWRATACSLACKLGQLTIQAPPLTVHGSLFLLAAKYRLFEIQLINNKLYMTVLNLTLLFLGQEFLYYWFHRAAHHIRWFWATHIVHHSSTQLNLSAAYRNGWTGKHTGSVFFYLPLVWIGFSPVAVFTMLSINLSYQFWIHNTWTPKLGRLEFVFNSPSAHRVHHAIQDNYINSNFGGVLIIFDRLFGTYKEELKTIPCRYGLPNQVISYNPFVIQFAEWKAILQDAKRSRNFKQFLTSLLRIPVPGARD